MICEFNIDANASGHLTEEATNAIKRSLGVLRLKEEEDNVQFIRIHWDGGGGGLVQSMYGPSISLEVLHVLAMATWTNCILHAVNRRQKALENASISKLIKKQGMNNNATFQQLCYQAIMLMVTVKKKGGHQLLWHYYAETLKHYIKSERWQAESSG
jgi:hypothetical protein